MSGLQQLRVRPGILPFICVIVITAGVLQVVQERAQQANAQLIVQRIQSGEADPGEDDREALLRHWSRRAEVGWWGILPGVTWIAVGTAGLAAYFLWRGRVRARIAPPPAASLPRNDDPS